ncbi:MAG: substrate-binding domain-containing protein [Chthoniobacteraceae bacterium]
MALGLNAFAFIYPSDQHAGIWSIVRGFQEMASADHRRAVMISADFNPKEEANSIGRLAEFDVKGAVVYPLITTPEEHVFYCQMLLNCSFPIVLVDVDLIGLGFPAVIGDGVHAGYTMTRHLLSQGIRKIGFLSDSSSKAAIRDRFHGYLLAMREASAPIEERRILMEPEMRPNISHPLDESTALARRLLAGAPEIEGVIGGTSYAAMGCIVAARELGMSIPDRLRIVSLDAMEGGIDGTELTRYKIDNREMGRLAYKVLQMKIENQPIPQSEFILRGEIIHGTTG